MSAAKKQGPVSERRLKVATPVEAKPKRAKREKAVVCAGPPPRVSRGPWTKEDSRRFDLWWKRRQQTDAAELQTTNWCDYGPQKGGIRSLGDLFMMMAGVSSMSGGGGDMSLNAIFHALASEIEVMAEAEMGKREERQKKLPGYASSDLYGPLKHLAQRLRAMGEIVPRIIRANYVHRSDLKEKP